MNTATSYQEIDAFTCPLDSKNIIEASAGTGKTYTILILLSRFLLEKKYHIQEISVLTFTDAAVMDLKKKIYETLGNLKKIFSSSFKPPEGESLLEHWYNKVRSLTQQEQQEEKQQEEWYRLISVALKNFNEANICTIHAFSRQLLMEFELESGHYLAKTLLQDEDTYYTKAVVDIWRSYFYRKDSFIASIIANSPAEDIFTIENLMKIAKEICPKLYNDGIVLLKEADNSESGKRQKAIKQIIDELPIKKACTLWAKERENFKNVLLENIDAFNKNKINTNFLANLNVHFANADVWFQIIKEERYYVLRLPALIEKCKLNQGSEKFDSIKSITNTLNVWQEIEDQVNEALAIINTELLHFLKNFLRDVKQRMEYFKKIHDYHTYDDLLAKLKEALVSKNKTLAKTIQKKYKVGIIDEFQDTNDMQYQIFTEIFQDVKTSVFYVGDPKQSIYKFRQADIHTYLKAVSHIDPQRRYKLSTNWRSEQKLLDAIEQIFTLKGEKTFLFDNINFIPVKAAKKNNAPSSINEKPLKICLLAHDDEQQNKDTKINKATANKKIAQYIADDIINLVKDDNATNINLQDIAILVRTNAEAADIQKVLAKHHIPYNIAKAQNIYKNKEAIDLYELMLAILEAHNIDLVKNTLASALFALKTPIDLIEHSNWLEQHAFAFKRYHEIWKTKSFYDMMQQIIDENDLEEKLLCYPEGEHALNNFHYFIETLSHYDFTNSSTPADLLQYYGKLIYKIEEEENTPVVDKEKSVQIMTIHASKGLEFPIVYLPFTYSGKKYSKKILFYYNYYKEKEQKYILDFSFQEKKEDAHHKSLTRYEDFAEEIRVLYVAMTRAKMRLIVTWGEVNGKENAPFGFLLNDTDTPIEKENFCAYIKNRENLSESRLNQISALASKQNSAIECILIKTLENNTGSFTPNNRERERKLQHRPFLGFKDIFKWQLSSFTAWIKKSNKELSSDNLVDAIDHKTTEENTTIEKNRLLTTTTYHHTQIKTPSASTILRVGKEVGIFFHNVMEKWDFHANDAMLLKKIVDDEGAKINLTSNEKYHSEIIIQKSILTPLTNTSFCLKDIPKQNRIAEMEFHYSTKQATWQNFAQIFSKATWYQQVQNLNALPPSGFMKGFIDLVFFHEEKIYLLDWKSNFLGNDAKDYHSQALEKIMGNEHYFLQAHIYSLALHLHWKQTLSSYCYEKNFGGVFYFFLRGTMFNTESNKNNTANYGVYFFKPQESYINQLEKLFIPATH